jgi:hypothetical protein
MQWISARFGSGLRWSNTAMALSAAGHQDYITHISEEDYTCSGPCGITDPANETGLLQGCERVQ